MRQTLEGFQLSRWRSFALINMILVLSCPLFLCPSLGVVQAQSVVSVEFSFTNEWGMYNGTASFVEGTEEAPVVVFLHGLGLSKEFHSWMVEPFVNAGYVLAMFNVPYNVPYGVLEVLSDEPQIEPYLKGWSPCIETLSGLEELEDVLRRPRIQQRFGVTEAQAEELLLLITEKATPVEISGELHLCRDARDDMLLETAIVGGATHIVSRDEDITRDLKLMAQL